MRDIWVIFFADRYISGSETERGDARERVIGMIMGEHFPAPVTNVDRYNTEEHTADDVSEELAREVARRVVALGDPPSVSVRAFIEDTLGVGTAIPAAA